ncbi:MAG: hypothetical protein H7Y14_00725, partial [Burkholderiales bacterium]|nr:hypothetical protein [Burkholderiales bacterium]
APAPSGAPSAEPTAQALRARYEELRDKLERNAFGRPLYLASSEAGRTQKGEVYAVLDYPFAVVQRGLTEAQSWCDVLILPYNTKHCHATGRGASSVLTLRIGRKADQAPEAAHPIAFKYAAQASADYLRVVLEAGDGPLGTRDYRIVLEATPLDERRTFIHLGYSYGFSALSSLAMQMYLSTAGASKVGFTVTGQDGGGNPVYVGGMLGATERNTMRYFLAIDAYLGSLAAPEAQRVEKRLGDWFAAAEKYPRQLREMERSEYLAMKRKETSRLKEAI